MRTMQKNEIGPLSYIIYKNQLKMDKALNVRAEFIKNLRSKYREKRFEP